MEQYKMSCGVQIAAPKPARQESDLTPLAVQNANPKTHGELFVKLYVWWKAIIPFSVVGWSRRGILITFDCGLYKNLFKIQSDYPRWEFEDDRNDCVCFPNSTIALRKAVGLSDITLESWWEVDGLHRRSSGITIVETKAFSALHFTFPFHLGSSGGSVGLPFDKLPLFAGT